MSPRSLAGEITRSSAGVSARRIPALPHRRQHEQAMRQDEARTTRLIQRLIDPAEGLPMTVIMPLMRNELSWDERWAEVEKKLAAPQG